jgi:hypothetical protein
MSLCGEQEAVRARILAMVKATSTVQSARPVDSSAASCQTTRKSDEKLRETLRKKLGAALSLVSTTLASDSE